MTSSGAASNNDTCDFFAFALEIRNMVYDELWQQTPRMSIEQEAGIRATAAYSEDSHSGHKVTSRGLPKWLFKVNKQFLDEALAQFHHSGRVELAPDRDNTLACAKLPFDSPSLIRMSKVRSLVMKLPTLHATVPEESGTWCRNEWEGSGWWRCEENTKHIDTFAHFLSTGNTIKNLMFVVGPLYWDPYRSTWPFAVHNQPLVRIAGACAGLKKMVIKFEAVAEKSTAQGGPVEKAAMGCAEGVFGSEGFTVASRMHSERSLYVRSEEFSIVDWEFTFDRIYPSAEP